jgi:hypothetical protein
MGRNFVLNMADHGFSCAGCSAVSILDARGDLSRIFVNARVGELPQPKLRAQFEPLAGHPFDPEDEVG